MIYCFSVAVWTVAADSTNEVQSRQFLGIVIVQYAGSNGSALRIAHSNRLPIRFQLSDIFLKPYNSSLGAIDHLLCRYVTIAIGMRVFAGYTVALVIGNHHQT